MNGLAIDVITDEVPELATLGESARARHRRTFRIRGHDYVGHVVASICVTDESDRAYYEPSALHDQGESEDETGVVQRDNGK